MWLERKVLKSNSFFAQTKAVRVGTVVHYSAWQCTVHQKSKVFVLQATMRCLRSIGKQQYTGSIYLSKENYDILDTELQANFRMTASEFSDQGPKPKNMLNVQVREDVKINSSMLSKRSS